MLDNERRTVRRLLFSISLVLVSLYMISACEAQPIDLKRITLPPGFTISFYADNVPGARSLTLGKAGTVFVGTREEGKVYALIDSNRKNRADKVITIAKGLNMPNGVAFHAGSLYVAEIRRVLRFDD